MTVFSFSEVPPRNVATVAEQRLKASPYYFLKRITCEYAEGTLTLRGRVPIPQLLPLAESIVADVDGVIDVANCLELGDPFTAGREARNAG